jgi:hypothetical protein
MNKRVSAAGLAILIAMALLAAAWTVMAFEWNDTFNALVAPLR